MALSDDQLAEITRRSTRDKWDCDMDALLQEVRALRAERDRYKAALERVLAFAAEREEYRIYMSRVADMMRAALASEEQSDAD